MASLCAKSIKAGVNARSSSRRSAVVVRASSSSADVNRRAALGALAGAAALVSSSAPASAAFGDAANVFGRITNKSGFVPYSGEGFAVLIPSKWNPSKEQDFKNVVLRYEDNGDAVNNFVVISEKTDKKSVEELGSPDQVLGQLSYLLGKQTWQGETVSEGGFANGKTSAASLLDQSITKDKKGRTSYRFEILTRTADGDEGGRHQLIAATVGNGQLWILKVQAGDKRWFKTAKKDCLGVFESFTIA